VGKASNCAACTIVPNRTIPSGASTLRRPLRIAENYAPAAASPVASLRTRALEPQLLWNNLSRARVQ
jgi:hypothetical protein